MVGGEREPDRRHGVYRKAPQHAPMRFPAIYNVER